MTNSRIGNAAEVAHLDQISKTLATVNADLAAARDSQRAAAKELKDIQGQIAAAIRAMAPSLPQNWSLPKLKSWLESRSRALEFSLRQRRQSAKNAKRNRTGKKSGAS